ncbi:MAG: type I-C CRISPR-associated endonuclease Cas1c [Mediterranea sp.]|jgi:CRISPR-associated protein Cas1|nr:type I-C CRISPR-associated endonuclease Cas1c [Mediterranea sp.]
MRKLLNTLYITTPDAYLSKDGMNVVVSVQQKETFRIPIINIESIVTFGYMGASPGLMKLCTDNSVSLTFLSPHGRFVSRVQGATRGNVLLRTAQYRLSEDKEYALHLSTLFVGGKIQNYRSILRRFVRDYGTNIDVENIANQLDYRKKAALRAKDFDQLRGIEGDAANAYFGVFPHLILQQKGDFIFTGRNRRPPKDAVNSMLSFVYTLIANDVAAALETVGLDPYVGFLHTLRPGRTSLALDVMEELRAYLGDRFVLSLINRRQISIGDFLPQGEEGITMTDAGRKTLLAAWQTRKKESIVHPYLNEKIPIGLLPYVQAMLLARYLRGDIDDYPVFLIR